MSSMFFRIMLSFWIAWAGMSCIGGERNLRRSSARAETDPNLIASAEVYGLKVFRPGHYRGENPAQGLALDFNRNEARLKHRKGDTVLRLIGYGYGNSLRTPRAAKAAD